MRWSVVLAALLVCYLLIIVPFTDSLQERPLAVKLGYAPNADILRMTARDYRFLLAESNVVRVLFYFGTLLDEAGRAVAEAPEYGRMYGQLVQAARLDPYNQDIYYFSQAIFTWDVGRALEVNKLLDYGMRYRTGDWQLPYWAGFNAAYFLKDYEAAARYFRRAAELSGSKLFTTLAARYFHEAGQGELGVLFLDGMIRGAKNPAVREVYEVRKRALEAAMTLQKAVATFERSNGRRPQDLRELVKRGILPELPEDPYGGSFYLTDSGEVKTTSKFAYGTEAESPAESITPEPK